MSSTAIRPRRVPGSVIAPSRIWFFGASSRSKRRRTPTTSPGIPFSISVRATRTVTGSPSSLTLLVYWLRYTSSTNAANKAAAPPRATVPPRVDSIFCMTCTSDLLIREHRDARLESALVAELIACAAVVQRGDVLDEVADDVSGVVVRNRVVTVSLARVPEAAALRSPAGDVEGPEADDRDGVVARAVEGAVRRDEDVEDARIARIDVRELAPAIRRRAGGRLLGAEDAEVEALRDLVRGAASLERDAVPGFG